MCSIPLLLVICVEVGNLYLMFIYLSIVCVCIDKHPFCRMAKSWDCNYHLQISYDEYRVDGVYGGKLYSMQLNEDAIAFYTVATLIEYYSLKKDGAITYVPHNKDPKRTSKWFVVKKIWRRFWRNNNNVYNVNLYVISSFGDEAFSRDPWMEELRHNSLLNNISNRRRMTERRITKLASQRQSELSQKAKRKHQWLMKLRNNTRKLCCHLL